MAKFLLRSLLIISCLFSIASTLHPATAQAEESASNGDLDEESEELSDEGSDDEEVAEEETPPPPEAPYPGADVETPATASTQNPSPQPSLPPSLAAEKPVRTNDDGEYFYSTTPQKPTPSGRPGAPPPVATSAEGEFFYGTETPPNSFSNRAGVEHPVQMNAQGEYFYPTESSKREGTASFRLGFITPPNIQNESGTVTFEDIYSESTLPVLLGDYEWQLSSSYGRLGLKFGSGLIFASGTGRFKTTNANRSADDLPEEKFTFITLPNQITAIYRFQYKDEQLIVPFIEGGGGYFAVTELRDDGKTPLFAGTFVTVAAGGLNILMDGLDRRSVRQLDTEYGINHVWLTLEYRQVISGLKPDLDFTTGIANAGFMMDF